MIGIRKRDFLVLPCDLMTELNPKEFLDQHRVNGSTMTALFYEPNNLEPASKEDGKLETTLDKRTRADILTDCFFDRTPSLCWYRAHAGRSCIQG